MEKQIPDENMDQYVNEYLTKNPDKTRGPKTPEGIARSAQNLLKKKKHKDRDHIKNHDPIDLRSLDNDPNYSREQADFFKTRHQNFMTSIPNNFREQYVSIVYILIVQEIELIEIYRSLNHKKMKQSEHNRIMKILDQHLNNFIRIQSLINLKRVSINADLLQQVHELKMENRRMKGEGMDLFVNQFRAFEERKQKEKESEVSN